MADAVFGGGAEDNTRGRVCSPRLSRHHSARRVSTNLHARQYRACRTAASALASVCIVLASHRDRRRKTSTSPPAAARKRLAGSGLGWWFRIIEARGNQCGNHHEVVFNALQRRPPWLYVLTSESPVRSVPGFRMAGLFCLSVSLRLLCSTGIPKLSTAKPRVSARYPLWQS